MIEHIKKDREGGTRGSWVSHSYRYPEGFKGDIYAATSKKVADCHHVARVLPRTPERKPLSDLDALGVIADIGPEVEANARRIARVPELEEYVLEAHELLKEVLAGACVNYAYIAPRNIERIKKLVGEA